MGLASLRRAVHVAVDAATAFEVFWSEIDAWYVRGPWSWNDPARAVGTRIEPGVGGRWVEVWDEATGDGYEIGRVVEWEPGRRLVLTYRNVHLPPEPATEIEVRFEPAEGGTKVVLEHRGWARLPPEAVARFVTRRAWGAFLAGFAAHAGGRAARG